MSLTIDQVRWVAHLARLELSDAELDLVSGGAGGAETAIGLAGASTVGGIAVGAVAGGPVGAVVGGLVGFGVGIGTAIAASPPPSDW